MSTSQENVDVIRRFIEAVERTQGSDDWRPVLAEVDLVKGKGSGIELSRRDAVV